jgi:hypothetical protein
VFYSIALSRHIISCRYSTSSTLVCLTGTHTSIWCIASSCPYFPTDMKVTRWLSLELDQTSMEKGTIKAKRLLYTIHITFTSPTQAWLTAALNVRRRCCQVSLKRFCLCKEVISELRLGECGRAHLLLRNIFFTGFDILVLQRPLRNARSARTCCERLALDIGRK